MDEAMQFDKIFRSSEIGISRLSDLLLNLEMSGWIRQLPGKCMCGLRKKRTES